MTKPNCFEVTPEIAQAFYNYNKNHGAWGAFHIVLDDPNLDDDSAAFCKKWAIENDDKEAIALSDYLIAMSPSQRRKLGNYGYPGLEKKFRK